MFGGCARLRVFRRKALAHVCGYHRTYVGGIERGERNITIATLEALAGGLGIDPRQLLVKD